MLKIFVLWIDMVQDSICIELVRSCENCYLVVFVYFLQHFYGVWANIEASINNLAISCCNIKAYIRWMIWALHSNAMSKGFVKIKD